MADLREGVSQSQLTMVDKQKHYRGSSLMAKKNPTPPKGFSEEPLQTLYPISFFHIITPDHSLTLTRQKRSHPQLPNLKIETSKS